MVEEFFLVAAKALDKVPTLNFVSMALSDFAVTADTGCEEIEEEMQSGSSRNEHQ